MLGFIPWIIDLRWEGGRGLKINFDVPDCVHHGFVYFAWDILKSVRVCVGGGGVRRSLKIRILAVSLKLSDGSQQYLFYCARLV